MHGRAADEAVNVMAATVAQHAVNRVNRAPLRSVVLQQYMDVADWRHVKQVSAHQQKNMQRHQTPGCKAAHSMHVYTYIRTACVAASLGLKNCSTARC
jgi:hypothetical protein